MKITSSMFFGDQKEPKSKYIDFTVNDYYKAYKFIYNSKSRFANIIIRILKDYTNGFIVNPNAATKQELINELYYRLNDELNEDNIYISPKTINGILTKLKKLKLVKLLRNNKWQITNFGYIFIDRFLGMQLHIIAAKNKSSPNKILITLLEEDE